MNTSSPAGLLAGIWQRETGEARPAASFLNLAREAVGEDGQLSFSRAVQLLVPAAEQWRGSEW